ncbi:MAG: cadherin repeat domain-containing protein, partial [Actinomycetia bacterium]|nr:cadherin repeat domain-containing protein [Actinomycetes bacterium]
MDASTGQLSLKTALPGSAVVGDTYELDFTLSDGRLSEDFTDIVVVTVVPPNNPPVVSDQSASVAENSPAGTTFGSMLTATAGDAGQTVSFEIESSVPAWGVEAIQVSATGQLSVKSDILDFENTTTITLSAYAVDDEPAAPAYTPFTI